MFWFPVCALVNTGWLCLHSNVNNLTLTLLIVLFDRRTGGRHLLDLSSALFGWLERPQLVLLVVNPGRGEASVVLWRAGRSRRYHGCGQVIGVRLNNADTVWTCVLEKWPRSNTSLTTLSFWLRWSCFCRISFGPVSVRHVDEPHHGSCGGSGSVKILGDLEVKKFICVKYP